MFFEVGVRAQVTEPLKTLWKLDKNRTKPRTLLVSFPNEYDARLVLAKTHENRKQPFEKEMYLFPALNELDSVRENMCLKKRRELIKDYVPKNQKS